MNKRQKLKRIKILIHRLVLSKKQIDYEIAKELKISVKHAEYLRMKLKNGHNSVTK